MHHHKWNIEYIDHLMPWEKEIYVRYARLICERKKAHEGAASSK